MKLSDLKRDTDKFRKELTKQVKKRREQNNPSADERFGGPSPQGVSTIPVIPGPDQQGGPSFDP